MNSHEAEVFKPYVHDDRYQVSQLGRVLGIRGRLMTPTYRSAYAQIVLRPRADRGRPRTKCVHVHSMVAETFLRPLVRPETVDHRDNQKGNNELRNLRIVSPSLNSHNQPPRGTTAPGWKGVHKKGNSYIASISVNNRTQYLGSFKTPEEAAARFNERAVAMYGSSARLNPL